MAASDAEALPPPSLSTFPPASSPTPITPKAAASITSFHASDTLIDGNSLPVPAGVNCIFDTPTGFHGISIHLETTGADSSSAPLPPKTAASITGAVALIYSIAAGAIANVGRDLCNWVKRRNNMEPTIPGLVDKLLFQDSVLHNYIIPVASIVLAAMSILHPADVGVLKELIPLLLKLAGGSVMCRYLGEEYQLICPEFAVIAMLTSKMFGFASFYIVILKFVTDNTLCSVLVYLSGVMAVFPLVMVVVNIFEEDVRRLEEIEGAQN